MLLIKNQRKTLLYFLLTFSLLAFISPLSETIFILLSAMVIVSPLILDDNNLLCAWLFTACFMSCFMYQTVFLAILDVSMIVFIIKTLAQKPLNKRNLKFACALLGFFLICFVYSCIVARNAYKVSQSIGIVLTIITLFLMKNISIKKAVLFLSLGLITSALLSTISCWSGLISINALGGNHGSYFRFGGYFCNVNALAMYCSICQACLLGLLVAGKINVKKWIWLLFSITLLGLSSFSKTFILITVATYGLAILIGFIQSKNKKSYIKYGCILLVILLALSPILYKYAQIMLGRFAFKSSGTEMVNSVTTGRFEIWKFYLEKLTSSPLYMLFGCGVTAPNIRDKTTHNFLISLLYKFGVVGIIVLLVALIYLFKQSKLTKNPAYYIPLITIAMNCLSEDLSCSLYTCLPALIAFMFILKKQSDSKN